MNITLQNLMNDAIKRKVNKPEAYSALESLICGAGGLPGDLQDTFQPYLTQLLAHFLPKVPAKPKTPEQWIARGCADQHERREYLRFVYSDGARLIGCNGNRLHVWNTGQYPKGYYEPGTMTPVVDQGKSW